MCGVAGKAVRADLSKTDFVTSEDKSVWIPCHRLDWLGVTWDSARGTIEIVNRRVVEITNTIDSIIASDSLLSARRLASFLQCPFPGTFLGSGLGILLCLL